MKRSLTILGFLFLYIIPSQAQELTFRSITYSLDRLLAKEPVVTKLDQSEAIIEFETLIPTPEAVIYYGVIPPEEELAYPRYRKGAKELLLTGTNRTKTHQLRLDISKLESVYYDTGLIANGGGVIAYRIEVYDPRINATQHYDRQFRYQRAGKPKIGKYTLHTSLTAGPFVDLVTPKSAVISWETEPPSNGAVSVNNTEVKSEEISAHHEVLLTGLNPSTQYTYRVQYASAGRDNPRVLVSHRADPKRSTGFQVRIYVRQSRRGRGAAKERRTVSTLKTSLNSRRHCTEKTLISSVSEATS